jgi:rhomboid family GlyGly-CTERM serine protease
MGLTGFVNRVARTLRALNYDGHHGRLLLRSCLLLLAIAALGEPARLLLRYDRAQLERAEYWRLLSAHLVHLDLRHALLNSVGLALVWALFARDYSVRQWLAVTLASAAAIDAGLWFAGSTVLWYVGSSGVLHGIMAAGTLAYLRRGEGVGWILAAALTAKLIYEQSVGALPFSGSDPVVVDAHLYGVLGGAAAAAFLRPQPVSL